MKIGIDARMYRSSVAGIGRYSQNLIKNLLEIDKENQYVLFMTKEDKKEFENYLIAFRHSNSLKIVNCKLPLGMQIVIAEIPHYSLSEQTKFAKIIANENLDLMHFLNVNLPVRYRGKFIVTIHDLTLIFYPETAQKTNPIKQAAFKYVMKKACRNSAKIIAVSNNTKNDIRREFQVPNDKIKVIYEAADDKQLIANGISRIAEQNIRNLKLRYAIRDTPVVLYVGQFRRHKNIGGLVKAFYILKKKFPCKLVMLGKSNDFTLDKGDDLRDIVRPGFVTDEELACWYKIASVFVFPSFYEGFGLPGLEAMRAGTPVVASNRSSLPEIYQDAAIYFDPFKTEDIADKIKMVLKDSQLRERLVERGKIIAAKYSWRKTAEETLDLYRQIQKSEILMSNDK